MEKKIVLTGVKPTGTPHIGNLVGAMRPMVDMINENEMSYVFVADLHALNTMRDKNAISQNTYEIVATYLSLGINLEKSILFRQSDILEVAVLSSLLMNVTPKGLMNKAHAYKAMVDKNLEQQKPEDDGVNMGLFTYPILMAADILLYKTDLVPVGKDQKQHVEFARDIANSFNYLYGNIFKIPEPILSKEAPTLLGSDGRKMSKSYGNIIPIFATEKELRKQVMKIKTDSKLPEEPKDPNDSLIIDFYKCFASPAELEEMKKQFIQGGMGYGTAKEELFRVMNEFLKEPREKHEYYMNHLEEIDKILENGANVAKVKAQETLQEVMSAMIG